MLCVVDVGDSSARGRPGPKKPFFVSRRTTCYGRRTTCLVREDKVCPPSLSTEQASDKACNQTGTHFHCYNSQKHLYVVICIFYLFHG